MRILIIMFFLFCTALSGQTTHYASVSGSGAQDGSSTTDEWTLSQAVSNAPDNSTVYVRSGSYPDLTYSITGSNKHFVGYDAFPGDVTTTDAPTYTAKNYTLSSGNMPLITRSNSANEGSTFLIYGDNVTLENFQMTGGAPDNGVYNPVSIQAVADGTVIKNVYIAEIGDQSTSAPYDSRAIDIRGVNTTIENSYIRDCTAEAISSSANATTVKNNYIYADNPNNPMDYYILVSGKTSPTTGAVITGNKLERTAGLSHGGHGIDLKYEVTGATVTDNICIGTNLEIAFPTCQYNTFENNRIEGLGTDAANWHAWIKVYNGARNNTFRNMVIKNVWGAISLESNAENSNNSSAERNSGGAANVFENIIVDGASFFLEANTQTGGDSPTPDGGYPKAEDYVFKNITLRNVTGRIVSSDMRFINFDWINVGSTGGTSAIDAFYYYSDPSSQINTVGSESGTTYTNCRTHSTSLNFPVDWTDVGSPSFVSSAIPEGSKLGASSAWIDDGSSLGTPFDFDGLSVQGSVRDVGAYEYNSGQTDTTPPVVSNVVISDITDTSARVAWEVNEGAQGNVFYDTNTGSGTLASSDEDIADYPSETTRELNYLTLHSQPINSLSSGTTYYFRIWARDSFGNTSASSEYSITTNGSPETSTNISGGGILGRMIKVIK